MAVLANGQNLLSVLPLLSGNFVVTRRIRDTVEDGNLRSATDAQDMELGFVQTHVPEGETGEEAG